MGYWWGVLGVIMVPQSDPPPKPLGVTVPHSSFIIWKWAQNLKPLPLRSSEALDFYLWAREVFGLDKDNHQKKLKFSQNRLNRLAGYENPLVLNDFWIIFGEILCHASTTKSQTSFIAGTIRVRPLLLFFSKKLRALNECGHYSSATYNRRNRVYKKPGPKLAYSERGFFAVKIQILK